MPSSINETRRAVAFFAEHAGTCQRPDESEAQAIGRCAAELATAEAWAAANDVEFVWELDTDIDSSDFSDDPEPWALWVCVAYVPDHSDALESMQVAASLAGVDFGRDGEPHGDPYHRVVEAELVEEVKQHLIINKTEQAA